MGAVLFRPGAEGDEPDVIGLEGLFRLDPGQVLENEGPGPLRGLRVQPKGGGHDRRDHQRSGMAPRS